MGVIEKYEKAEQNSNHEKRDESGDGIEKLDRQSNHCILTDAEQGFKGNPFSYPFKNRGELLLSAGLAIQKGLQVFNGLGHLLNEGFRFRAKAGNYVQDQSDYKSQKNNISQYDQQPVIDLNLGFDTVCYVVKDKTKYKGQKQQPEQTAKQI